MVNFFKPETMYFDTSQINTTALEQASGIQDRDKNKIIRLEFSGARQLWGLPGGVWDFCTDQALEIKSTTGMVNAIDTLIDL